MQITAKSGDDGYTDLIGGNRLPKDHPILECLGTLDELNAFIDDVKVALGDNINNSSTAKIIDTIQKDLFTIMDIIAGMPVPPEGIGEERLASLIAELKSTLPPFDCLRGVHTPPFRALKKGMYPETDTLPKQHTPSLQGGVVDSFVIPGANPVSAKLHIARTVCRRAERRLISLEHENKAAIMPYINRLSNLLFLLAQKEVQ